MRFWLLIGACLLSQPTFPSQEDLSKRAQSIYAQVKCPVCKGQSLSDSEAPIAEALRAKIFESLQKGMGEEMILQELSNQFGESINLSPPINRLTYILWVAPFSFFLIGAFLLFLRKR